jgi:hypothetical protein
VQRFGRDHWLRRPLNTSSNAFDDGALQLDISASVNITVAGWAIFRANDSVVRLLTQKTTPSGTLYFVARASGTHELVTPQTSGSCQVWQTANVDPYGPGGLPLGEPVFVAARLDADNASNHQAWTALLHSPPQPWGDLHAGVGSGTWRGPKSSNYVHPFDFCSNGGAALSVVVWEDSLLPFGEIYEFWKTGQYLTKPWAAWTPSDAHTYLIDLSGNARDLPANASGTAQPERQVAPRRRRWRAVPEPWPVDTGTPVSSAIASPTENVQGVSATAVTPTEAVQGVSNALLTPTESEAEASSALLTPTEAVAEAVGAGQTPTEALEQLETAGQTPTEHEQVLATTALTPTESEAGASDTAQTPTENVLAVADAGVHVSPWEALEGIQTPVVAGAQVHWEALQLLAVPGITPTEHEAPASSAAVTPTENVQELASAGASPTENVQEAAQGVETPDESLSIPVAAGQTPTEHEAEAAVSATSPWESIEYVPPASETTPTENIQEVSDEETTPWEALQGVAPGPSEALESEFTVTVDTNI